MNDDNYISEEEFEELERYLDSRPSDEEKAAFEKRLLEDNSLRTKLEELIVLRKGIQLAVLQGKLDLYHSRMKARHKQAFIKRAVLIMAASVSLVLIGISIWLLVRPPFHSRIYQANFSPDPGLMTTMSTATYEFADAMVDYKTGNYENAIRKWEAILPSKPDNDTLIYFIGVSYLANDMPEKSIPLLQQASSISESVFRQEAHHYLGMAYLRQGELNLAEQELEKSESEKSRKILDKLRERP